MIFNPPCNVRRYKTLMVGNTVLNNGLQQKFTFKLAVMNKERQCFLIYTNMVVIVF
jgi:hypothetical protein